MRLVQHKKEAFWFYRFLSIFYDNYVNPFFWSERMREELLPLGRFDSPDLKVIDVGSGTGFTTAGIARRVHPENITCIDQSPHQMARARQKPELQGCNFQLGDAEDIPFPTDTFDRYVSAGSIEYWPEPARGVTEAYRVLKPGGRATLIGPLRPENEVARFIADTWMLFPSEIEYRHWFEQAGFTDIEVAHSRPSWVEDEAYGVAITGVKPLPGESPLNLPPQKAEDVDHASRPVESAVALVRLFVGSLAGGLFIPMALLGYARQWFKLVTGQRSEPLDPLTRQQNGALLIIVGLLLLWKRRQGRKA